MPMGRWAKTAGAIAYGVDANGPLGEDRWDDSRWAMAAADVGALGRFGHKKEDDRAVTLSEISERYCNPFYSSYSSLLRRSC